MKQLLKRLDYQVKRLIQENIMMFNYGHIDDPSALFGKAIADLEAFIKKSKKE